MSLLAIGSIGLDEIVTPFGESGVVAGGSVIYTAWSASHFVSSMNVVSIAGEDFPRQELKQLHSRGVNFDGLKTIPGGKTFRWKGSYHQDMNGRDTLLTDLNVLEQFDPILPKHYLSSHMVMLGNIAPLLQMKVLDQLDSKPKLIGLDTMNFWMDTEMDVLKEVIAKVDILFLNDTEALQLSNERTLKKAIDKLQLMGPKYVCVKKGEHGAILVEGSKMFMCPALPLGKIVDPTGAGDSFAGGIMGYLSQQEDISFSKLQSAVLRGTAMASFCVEEFATIALKQIQQEDINLRVQRIQQMIYLHED